MASFHFTSYLASNSHEPDLYKKIRSTSLSIKIADSVGTYVSGIGSFSVDYCLDCIRPRITLHCDGTSESIYKTCPTHLNPPKPGATPADLIWYSRPSPRHYHAIRCKMGEDIIVDMMHEFTQDKIRDIPFGHCPVCSEEEVKDAASRELMPSQTHVNGCLHSDKPGMIINRRAGRSKPTTRPSKLATSLYFKRCDGSYKNVIGQRLNPDGKDESTI